MVDRTLLFVGYFYEPKSVETCKMWTIIIIYVNMYDLPQTIISRLYLDGRGLDQGCQTYKKVCELTVRTGFVLPF